MKTGDWLLGICVGFLSSSTVFIILLILVNWKPNIEWETLTIGAFATFGAAATVFAIRQQISNESYWQRQALINQENSARAAANDALSKIVNSANQIAMSLHTNKVSVRIDSSNLLPFYRLAASIDETTSRNSIALIRRIQVLNSRLEGSELFVLGTNRVILFINCLEIVSIADSLWSFLRFETSTPGKVSQLGVSGLEASDSNWSEQDWENYERFRTDMSRALEAELG